MILGISLSIKYSTHDTKMISILWVNYTTIKKNLIFEDFKIKKWQQLLPMEI